MGDQTVLVGTDADTAGELAGVLDQQGVVVRAVTDVTELFESLCYDSVAALVVPTEMNGASGRHVARGVRSLYPELPVVVVNGPGDEDGSAPGHDEALAGKVDEAEFTVVDAATLTDEGVVDSISDVLTDDGSGAAGRPPSRLETLAMSMFAEFPDNLYAKDENARHLLTTGNVFDVDETVGRTDDAIPQTIDEHTNKTVGDDQYVINRGNSLIKREEFADTPGKHILTTKVPWRGPDGSPIGLIGFSQDISAWKSKERTLRQQNERLAKIAIVAAHELRNELQVASGRLDLAAEDPSQLAVVDRSLSNLERIVDDVVTLAGAETGPTAERTVWLSTPAREVWESLPSEEATFEVAEDRLVEADPRSLRLFFEILLSNALEHAGADVTVTLGATEDGFYVADDGDGIDMDPPEQVFDVGFELEGENVGLGLYVARRIARDHGWSLDASNRTEGGARFDVTGVSDLGD